MCISRKERYFQHRVANPMLASGVGGGLQSPFRGTRFRVSLALKEKHAQVALPAIQGTLAGEVDQMIQIVLGEALQAGSLVKSSNNHHLAVR